MVNHTACMHTIKGSYIQLLLEYLGNLLKIWSVQYFVTSHLFWYHTWKAGHCVEVHIYVYACLAHGLSLLNSEQVQFVAPTSEEFDLLLRQMRERLDNGQGETIYELGIGGVCGVHVCVCV